MPQRLRANTVDSIQVPPPPPSDTGTSSSRNLTPTRRAPPAPPVGAAGKTSSSTRRKPVRPAPVAPGTRRKHSQTQPILSPTSLTSHEGVGPVAMVLEFPPPSYSDASSGTPVHSQEVGGVMDSLGSGVHPIMDLNIHTEQDDFEHEMRYHHDNEGGARSLRPQSVSDTFLLMHQNSASLPDLMNCDGVEVGVTNGGVVTEGVVAGEGRNRGSHLQRSASGASQSRHTRHLSLIGTEDIQAAKQPPRDHRKKRSSRRNGSIKLRSRSPPNMPPPPPPQEDSDETLATNGQISLGAEQNQPQRDQTDFGLHVPPMQNGVSGELPSQSSSSSVGFSEVMNTISNIDHELDDMTITPTQPSIPAPQRSVSGSGNTTQVHQGVNFAVGGGRDGGMKDDFNEEEWLCDAPNDTTPISPNRPAPEGGPPSAEEDSETEPIQKKTTNQITSQQQAHDSFVPAEQLVSSGFISAAAVNTTFDLDPPKAGKGKHRVMFKEEVEDIPSYEPRVDREVNGEEVS